MSDDPKQKNALMFTPKPVRKDGELEAEFRKRVEAWEELYRGKDPGGPEPEGISFRIPEQEKELAEYIKANPNASFMVRGPGDSKNLEEMKGVIDRVGLKGKIDGIYLTCHDPSEGRSAMKSLNDSDTNLLGKLKNVNFSGTNDDSWSNEDDFKKQWKKASGRKPTAFPSGGGFHE